MGLTVENNFIILTYMIDQEKQDKLMAKARAHLQAAYEAVKEVSEMHWDSDHELQNIYMRIGALG